MSLVSETPHTDVVQLLTGHFRERSGYRAYRPRGVGDWLLILTVSGQGRFSCQDKDMLAEGGDWVLLPPGTPHDYGVASDAAHWDLLWAHFRPRPDWAHLLRWPTTDGIMHFRATDAQDAADLAAQFDRVHKLRGTARRHAEALAMNALEALLLLCDEQFVLSAAYDGRVQRAMDFVDAKLGSRLTVADIAGAAGLSASRLSHLFKAETGLSVQAFVEARRLRRASDLLDRTGFSIKQIAAQTGFDSPFYFSRRFSLRFGQSPQDYRRRREAPGRPG